MTCIDKLRELYPDWDEEKVRYHVDHNCPHAEYILPRPLGCGAHGWEDSDDDDCEKCWNRDIPEIVDDFRHESLLYLTSEDMRRLGRLAKRTGYSRDNVASVALKMYEDSLDVVDDCERRLIQMGFEVKSDV